MSRPGAERLAPPDTSYRLDDELVDVPVFLLCLVRRCKGFFVFDVDAAFDFNVDALAGDAAL